MDDSLPLPRALQESVHFHAVFVQTGNVQRAEIVVIIHVQQLFVDTEIVHVRRISYGHRVVVCGHREIQPVLDNLHDVF